MVLTLSREVTQYHLIVVLVVLFPSDSPYMNSSSPDMTVVTGDDVYIECVASGFPQPQISWYKYSETNERTC